MAKLSKKISYYSLVLIVCLLSAIAVSGILTTIIEIGDPILALIIAGLTILPIIFITYWACKKLIEGSKEL